MDSLLRFELRLKCVNHYPFEPKLMVERDGSSVVLMDGQQKSKASCEASSFDDSKGQRLTQAEAAKAGPDQQREEPLTFPGRIGIFHANKLCEAYNFAPALCDPVSGALW